MDPKDAKRLELAINFAFEEYCEDSGITSHDLIDIIEPTFEAGFLEGIKYATNNKAEK